MRRFRPLSLVCAALAITAFLGACGGSKAAKPTAAQCAAINTVISAAGAAATSTKLADAKQNFQKLVTATDALTSPPSPIKSDVAAFKNDVNAMNTFLQTQATQADLSGNAAPAAVAGPSHDLGVRGQHITNYAKANCPTS